MLFHGLLMPRDWLRQRDAEAARQRDIQMRHADDPAESINVDADDDAINVAAYRQELESRQRDADALAVVAAANVRNRAEIVIRPMDASARLAEIAAHAQLSHDAADAEHPVVPVAAAAPELAAAPAEGWQRHVYQVAAAAPEPAAAPAEACAADIVLWENAYNVDIVDGAIVAMWSDMPGLQDDPAAAAADLLATQQADAARCPTYCRSCRLRLYNL